MKKLKINKEVNSSKLMQELLDLELIQPTNEDGTSTIRDSFVFINNDENVELVQQVIDKHDPSPLPIALSEIDLLKLSQAEQFELILEFIGGM